MIYIGLVIDILLKYIIIFGKVHISTAFNSNFLEKMMKNVVFRDFAPSYHFQSKNKVKISLEFIHPYFHSKAEEKTYDLRIKYMKIGQVVLELYHQEAEDPFESHTRDRFLPS